MVKKGNDGQTDETAVPLIFTQKTTKLQTKKIANFSDAS